MAERTWDKREAPLLEEIARDESEGPTYGLSSDQLADRTHLDVRLARISLSALLDDGYIKGSRLNGGEIRSISLTPDGRRAVRQWPGDDIYEELLRVLDERIARAASVEEKGELQRFRDSAGEVGRGVIAAALWEVVRVTTGLR